MLKLMIGLFIGLTVGAFSGYYYSENINSTKLSALDAEKESKTKELSHCQEKLVGLEKQLQDSEAILKLNEDRPCFVTTSPLNAPEIVPSGLDPIQSNNLGDIILNWTPVKGAKKYLVKIETESGEVINTTEVEGEPTLYLNRVSTASMLPTNNYFVSIAAVNGLDQEGAASNRRPIVFLSQTVKTQSMKSKLESKLKSKIESKLKSKENSKMKTKSPSKKTSKLPQ